MLAAESPSGRLSAAARASKSAPASQPPARHHRVRNVTHAGAANSDPDFQTRQHLSPDLPTSAMSAANPGRLPALRLARGCRPEP